jgi:hypothetical protein
MRVLKLTFEKIIFLQIFLKFQIFSVKCLDGLISYVQTRAVLPYADLEIAHPVRISIGLRLAFLSLPYTHLCIFLLIYHGMLCVFLVDFSRDFGIFCTSLLIP